MPPVRMRTVPYRARHGYLYTVSGFAVGAIVGLHRRGRRFADDPLLVLLFGVHPATAVGTDLLYAALTKSGGTVAHGRKGPHRLGHHRPPGPGSIPPPPSPSGCWRNCLRAATPSAPSFHWPGFALLTATAIPSAAACGITPPPRRFRSAPVLPGQDHRRRRGRPRRACHRSSVGAGAPASPRCTSSTPNFRR